MATQSQRRHLADHLLNRDRPLNHAKEPFLPEHRSGTTAIGIEVTGSPVLAATIDGRVVDPSKYRYQTPDWQLTYWAAADSGFTLSLVVPKDAKPVVSRTRQIAGLPTLPGVTIPPRSSGVLPSQTGDISVVYKRLTF